MVEFNYQIKSARRELNIRQNREVSIMKHKLVSVVLAAAILEPAGQKKWSGPGGTDDYR